MVSRASVQSSGARGFTLAELIVGISLSAVITLGVISSFTFVGRNLVRLSNHSELQTRSAIAIATLQKDVARTTSVFAASPTSLSLTLNNAGTSETVTYLWDATRGEVTRIAPFHSYVVLRKVTQLQFSYADADGNVTAVPAAIRRIEWDATTAAGLPASGTHVVHPLVSPAMLIAGTSF